MKTPAEFEPIAVWMGWTKIFSWSTDGDWLDEDNQYRGVVATKTSLTDAEAVSALDRLAGKKYGYALENQVDEPHKHRLLIFTAARYASGWHPTISAAVEEALLELIAAEGEQA